MDLDLTKLWLLQHECEILVKYEGERKIQAVKLNFLRRKFHRVG
jgi:hypothetical protein